MIVSRSVVVSVLRLMLSIVALSVSAEDCHLGEVAQPAM